MAKKVSYTQSEIDAMPLLRMTFLYLEVGESGTPYNIWLDDDGKAHSYDGKNNIAPAAPGMIYAFPQSGPTAILTSCGKYVGKHESDDDVLRWTAMHRANRERLASMRKVAAAAKEDALLKQIEPLARAYTRMKAPQRAQFIAWIVRKIVQADLTEQERS